MLSVLLGRVSEYHRIQHVYVHHVEDNGPRDSETTTPYDRTSFLDFSRHAFLQGIDMLTGVFVFNYLRAKGKKRQLRKVLQGFLVWYAVLAVIALFNPIAALLALLSRFVGGNVRSLISFWQHGLVDPEDVHDIHGNSVDFVGHERQPRRRLPRRASPAAWPALERLLRGLLQAGRRRGQPRRRRDAEGDVRAARLRCRALAEGLPGGGPLRPLRGVEAGDDAELARIVEEHPPDRRRGADRPRGPDRRLGGACRGAPCRPRSACEAVPGFARQFSARCSRWRPRAAIAGSCSAASTLVRRQHGAAWRR